jgi:hypothetical protein
VSEPRESVWAAAQRGVMTAAEPTCHDFPRRPRRPYSVGPSRLAGSEVVAHWGFGVTVRRCGLVLGERTSRPTQTPARRCESGRGSPLERPDSARPRAITRVRMCGLLQRPRSRRHSNNAAIESSCSATRTVPEVTPLSRSVSPMTPACTRTAIASVS